MSNTPSHRSPALSRVGELLEQGFGTLRRAGVPDSRREAEWLLAAALGFRRGRLNLAVGERVPTARRQCFEAWCNRRARREPLQYVLGSQPFRACTIRVDERVLIPRPETERVMEFALRFHLGGAIADVGTGSGAIAISLALERSGEAVYATDISSTALALARENAALAGVRNVRFLEGDLLSALGARAKGCALIVCNPPYVATRELEALEPEVRDWEPRLALDGGPDGLDFYRRLAIQAADAMAPGAWLVVEVGAGQRESVERAFMGRGAFSVFSECVIERDYAGIERALAFRRSEVTRRLEED